MITYNYIEIHVKLIYLKNRARKKIILSKIRKNKLSNVFVGIYEHSFLDLLVVFLVENGTITYLKPYNAFDNNSFYAQKIDNISNVIKIVGASMNDSEDVRKIIIGLRNDELFMI